MENVTTATGKMTDLEKHVLSLANQVEHAFDEPEGELYDSAGPVMDFLESVLEIEWIVASDRQTLKGARLLVTFGGPNIWVDTRRGIVEGYWWSESAFQHFDNSTSNAMELHDALEMLWAC